MLSSRYFSRTVPAVAQRFYASHSYEIKTTFAPDGTRTSVLENGVKIVQIPKEDTSVALGLFVNVGSVNETHQTHGSSHYLRRFLYKGTNKTSGLRITRTIENLTSQFEANNGRETLAYTATTHPGHVRDVAEILADVLRPRLAEWEFREVKELVKDDIEQRKSNLIATLGDKVRHTAFRGVGLGRAPVIPEYNLDQIYPEQLADWIGSNVIGERITLVIAGNTPYDDEGLIKSLAVIFAALPASSIGSGPAAPVVASNYYGGELVEAGGPSNIYVEAYKGAQAGSKDHVAQLVLANILGDATSEFLPGNNLTSRFAKEFSGDEFSLVSSFNSHDSQTLFGVRAVGSAPTKVLAEKVHSQLSNLATNKITEEELNRSRNILKTRLKLFRDSRNGFLLGTWKYGNGSAFDGALDALTPQSLQQVASNLLSTPRTTVVKGDLTDLPSFK